MTEELPPMSAPTLVLISGFARAGKDTLASGILEWSRRPSSKINFADVLKEASNQYLDYLQIEGDFFNEQFKCQHRDFLVAAGRLARSLDQDIFAKHLANFVPCIPGVDEQANETVVTSDWRYENELRTCQDILWPLGWKVRTVYVSTAGIGPANDEEADSILAIRAGHSFDQEYIFKPDDRNAIMTEGRSLARQWRL
jgi:hypothetical protein